MLELTRRLHEHLEDVHDTAKLFALATEYDKRGQCAAAVPFYLRCADNEWEDTLLQYTCLLRMAIMYHRLGRRTGTVEGILQNAITLRPDRPEAWYWLCSWCVEKSHWKRAFMYAASGLLCEEPTDDIDCKYPGRFGLLYFDALADWKIRGIEESKEKTFEAKTWYNGYKDPEYLKKFDDLLLEHGYPQNIRYNSSLYSNWKIYFPGLEYIEKNYSRRLQDMIVLSLLKGKRNGTYLQIGALFGDRLNNTYLLEKDFEWTGTTIEKNPRVSIEHKKIRKNGFICKDPMSIDYTDFLEYSGSELIIDYLQVDHGFDSMNLVMEKIPFSEYKFRIVTFGMRQISGEDREVYKTRMRKNGYTLLAESINTSPTPHKTGLEDVWVNLPLLDGELYNKVVSEQGKYITDGWFYE